MSMDLHCRILDMNSTRHGMEMLTLSEHNVGLPKPKEVSKKSQEGLLLCSMTT